MICTHHIYVHITYVCLYKYIQYFWWSWMKDSLPSEKNVWDWSTKFWPRGTKKRQFACLRFPVTHALYQFPHFCGCGFWCHFPVGGASRWDSIFSRGFVFFLSHMFSVPYVSQQICLLFLLFICTGRLNSLAPVNGLDPVNLTSVFSTCPATRQRSIVSML